MAFEVYIVNPGVEHAATMNLRPGYYITRLRKGGPYVLVHAEVIEERDEVGDLMADVEYRLKIDNDFILDWDKKFPNGLPGDPISKEEYEAMRRDIAWTKENWGVALGEKSDLTKLPSIMPPGM